MITTEEKTSYLTSLQKPKDSTTGSSARMTKMLDPSRSSSPSTRPCRRLNTAYIRPNTSAVAWTRKREKEEEEEGEEEDEEKRKREEEGYHGRRKERSGR